MLLLEIERELRRFLLILELLREQETFASAVSLAVQAISNLLKTLVLVILPEPAKLPASGSAQET